MGQIVLIFQSLRIRSNFPQTLNVLCGKRKLKSILFITRTYENGTKN
ncbi:hypothetical protein LEP1GSC005_3227 [Leptospira santarosai str. ST188]|uniref:Uncharacterized protein n=2 Tax=Leptospira santarosai TaxID=28183 RepID=A0A0E2BEL0_9LEPT|nr:hypothetical protein LEP1GSC179_3234 [Leptospira santarosai str. MOR084]EKO76890.1 hypothetical protein LEP1GSC068_1640 [Leptospira sp. Fiocruz LV3954]EMF92562.1 hypothetical protein LEP1GSC005_3227 [Leptospira santarosai str. ST188]EMI60426.1 hypothetical protein LEP1GSC076_0584 [Leptospira sp. Fiocruz LV4135]EMJ48861.1 hypothetical protein LEP1GSC169_1505 [Leptospira santarosai str. HAI1349]EMN23716.1 hypothetical protein LEP1GSC063_1512 [Leptospira santarosai serovar Arenal str. MAVJ 401